MGIDKEAFFACANIEKVSMPNSVKYIGEDAFFGCTNLKDFIMSSGIRYIEEGAFGSCDNLIFNEKDNGLYLGNDDNKYSAFIKMKDNEANTCMITKECKCVYINAFKDNGITYNKNITRVYYNLDKEEYDYRSLAAYPKVFSYCFTKYGNNEDRKGTWWYYDTDGKTIIEIEI